MDTGCSGCHNGAVVGGGMVRKFGVVEDYCEETGSQEPDIGRFNVTMNPADTYVFKVPGLRNVAMEPLYFHDGSVRSCWRPFALWPGFNWARRSPVRTRTRS
jgi:cytochrome c peroxidase